MIPFLLDSRVLTVRVQLAGDKSSAKQWYERSSVHSKRLGLARDGAADALRRLASSN